MLESRRVKALIVGAHAVAFHAKPRYTKDVDVLVEPSVGNAERLLEALSDFGFGSLDLAVEDFSQEGKIVQLGFEPNRVDLITSIGGTATGSGAESPRESQTTALDPRTAEGARQV